MGCDRSIQSLAQLVFEWAESAFPDRTDASMFLKLYEEVAETIRSGGDPMEVADLFILLLDYAVRHEIDLERHIRVKLAINRKRTWHVNSTGTMSHDKQ